MESRYELTNKGREYLRKGKVMCKPNKHDFMPVFTDKVNGVAIVITMCKKCGESERIERYVGDNTQPHQM